MKTIFSIIVLTAILLMARFNHPQTVSTGISLKNIRTDRVQIYEPTAICWYCSCWAPQLRVDPAEKQYLTLLAANLQLK